MLTIEYNKGIIDTKTKPFTGRIKDNVSSQLEAVSIKALQKCRAFFIIKNKKPQELPTPRAFHIDILLPSKPGRYNQLTFELYHSWSVLARGRIFYT